VLLRNVHEIAAQRLYLVQLVLDPLVFALHFEAQEVHFFVGDGGSRRYRGLRDQTQPRLLSGIVRRGISLLPVIVWWFLRHRILNRFIIINFAFENPQLFLQL